MKVLMISNDQAFLGVATSTGDAISRHRAYGQLIEKLAIVVLTQKRGFTPSKLSDRVSAYPAYASTVWGSLRSAVAVGRDLFAGDRYDLIVCQDPFLTGLVGYFLKKKFGPRLLIDFHGDFWDNPYWLGENILHRPMLALSRFTVSRADALRAVSLGIKQKLTNHKIKKPIAVIPTPVNLENFKTPDPQTVVSIKNQFPGQKIILWTGRLSVEKNLSFLVSSFAKIAAKYPSVVLLLAGSGPEKTKIEQLVASLKLAGRVKLLGQTNYQLLLNYFHAADIFVLPSRHESFGKVLVEAGASGKPSVASATTGAKEVIIDGQTGFLFPVNNSKKFINHILTLLNDENLAHQMGAAAYQSVWQKYDWSASLKNVVAYWQKIVAHKK